MSCQFMPGHELPLVDIIGRSEADSWSRSIDDVRLQFWIRVHQHDGFDLQSDEYQLWVKNKVSELHAIVRSQNNVLMGRYLISVHGSTLFIC